MDGPVCTSGGKKKERCNGFFRENSPGYQSRIGCAAREVRCFEKIQATVCFSALGALVLFHYPAKRVTRVRGRRGRFSSRRPPPPRDNAGLSFIRICRHQTHLRNECNFRSAFMTNILIEQLLASRVTSVPFRRAAFVLMENNL